MGERNPAEYEELTISKIKHGGFVVRQLGYGGNMTMELFASTDIGEALGFIRTQLMGRPVASEAVGQANELVQFQNLKPGVTR